MIFCMKKRSDQHGQTPLSPKQAARLLLTPARPRARAMPRPTKALRQILRPMGKKFGPGVHELKLRWDEIAGPRLAPVSTPEKLTSGKSGQILTIKTRGGAAMLVQAQSVQLLERINLVAGSGRVTSLRTIQGPIGDMKQAPKPKPDKINCQPEQLDALNIQLADISDPALKSALFELGQYVIGRDQLRR